LQQGIDSVGIGRVASVIGRYYAMDRDNRWDRTELAYRASCWVKANRSRAGKKLSTTLTAPGENDEFIKPRLINYKGIGHNDCIIFFNFRSTGRVS